MSSELEIAQVDTWGLTFRGIAAIIFGFAAVFWPGLTLVTLLYIFSAWVIVSGIIRMFGGVAGIGHHEFGFLTLVVGLLEIGVGVYLLRHPGVSFATLILLIGFLLIIGGVMEAIAVLFEKASATAKTLTFVVAVASVLAGVLMLFQPAKSGVAFVWIIGLYALVSGPLLIALSLDVRSAAAKQR